MKPNLLSLLLVLAVFPACKKKDKTVVVDKLVFGTYKEICSDGCTEMYRIDANALYRDTAVKNMPTGWDYAFSQGVRQNDSKQAEAKSLLTGVPEELLSRSEVRYGANYTPEYTTLYVEITKDGTVYKSRIIMGASSVSSPVGDYAGKVQGEVELLR